MLVNFYNTRGNLITSKNASKKQIKALEYYAPTCNCRQFRDPGKVLSYKGPKRGVESLLAWIFGDDYVISDDYTPWYTSYNDVN